MNILPQVPAFFWVGLVCPYQSVERSAVLIDGVRVEDVLIRCAGRDGLGFSHTSGSRSHWTFLTNQNEKLTPIFSLDAGGGVGLLCEHGRLTACSDRFDYHRETSGIAAA